jgi:hypothetical protein
MDRSFLVLFFKKEQAFFFEKTSDCLLGAPPWRHPWTMSIVAEKSAIRRMDRLSLPREGGRMCVVWRSFWVVFVLSTVNQVLVRLWARL